MSYARIRTCGQEKWYNNVVRIEGLRGYDQGGTYLVLHLSEHPTRVCYWIGKGSPIAVLLCATGADVTTVLREEACARLDRQIEDRIYYESITSSTKETNPPLLPPSHRSETSPSRYATGHPPQTPQPQGQGGAGGTGVGTIPGDVEQGSRIADWPGEGWCLFCGKKKEVSIYADYCNCSR